MFYYSVSVSHPIIEILNYSYKERLPFGTLVLITIKNTEYIGMIMSETKEENHLFKIKEIQQVLNISLPLMFITFIQSMGIYNMCGSFVFLKNILKMLKEAYESKDIIIKKNKKKEKDIISIPIELKLSEEQNIVFNEIDITKDNISLIFGITGCGKTEISLKKMEVVFLSQKPVLILVPEIGIIDIWEKRIKKYFPHIKPVIWHSGESSKKNNIIDILNINNDSPKIIIGTRSSLMLPINNLGLIIVDEEHDSSYKQETSPIYNGRDMAIMRGKIEQIPVILLSATPSVESFYMVQQKKINMFILKNRYTQCLLPDIKVVYKGLYENITEELEREIRKNLITGHQSLIYLNKRGYSFYLSCGRCKIVLRCINCTSCLVVHKIINKLVCHYCNGSYSFICNHCNHNDCLETHGVAIEKIKEILIEKFPEARIVIFSSDYCSSLKKTRDMMEKISNNEVDIIIGTQMISKGYDIKNLTLVGIIDVEFLSSDFRGKEHLYQSVIQVSGRAGRHLPDARVIVQGVFNKDYCTDYLSFLKEELFTRIKCGLPPMKKLILLEVKDFKEERLLLISKSIYNDLINGGINASYPFAGRMISKVLIYKIVIIKERSFNDNIDKIITSLKKKYSNLSINVDASSV
jgi:primosomal protein N' (replication factor Y)